MTMSDQPLVDPDLVSQQPETLLPYFVVGEDYDDKEVLARPYSLVWREDAEEYGISIHSAEEPDGVMPPRAIRDELYELYTQWVHRDD